MIPTEPVDRKLSKIEVLRLATSYIQHLVNQLNSGNFGTISIHYPIYNKFNRVTLRLWSTSKIKII